MIHTSQTQCVAFQMGSVAPWHRLCNWKILARYLKIPIFEMTLSITQNNLLVSSKPLCRNPYLKAVHYVIRDSRRTTWLKENYVTQGKLRDSQGNLRRNPYFVVEKLRNSWKTTWFTKNYMIHQKLVDNFLLERNNAKLWLHCQNIGIHIIAIYESYCLNWEINDFYKVPS